MLYRCFNHPILTQKCLHWWHIKACCISSRRLCVWRRRGWPRQNGGDENRLVFYMMTWEIIKPWASQEKEVSHQNRMTPRMRQVVCHSMSVLLVLETQSHSPPLNADLNGRWSTNGSVLSVTKSTSLYSLPWSIFCCSWWTWSNIHVGTTTSPSGVIIREQTFCPWSDVLILNITVATVL